MSDNIEDRLNKALSKLKTLIEQRADSGDGNLIAENKQLKQELENLRRDYQILVKTSEDVVNELNNSVRVIDNFFKKQNADN